MKKSLKLAMVAFIALASFSCSNDNNNPIVIPTVDNSITGIASRNPDLSILVQALTRADLAATLKGSGSFTVFAPTNTAFQTFLGAGVSVNDVPVATLKEILLNHVISGALTSTQLTTGYVKTLAKGTASATNTLSMFVDTTTGVKLNGVSTVTTANITASNGVIHVVDAVIGLPTIVTHATANSNFSSLVGALTSAGQPDFVGILSGTGPFTVFAPTNDAFTSLNTELAPGGIAGVSASNLTKVLQYHVVSGNVLAASLTEGQIVNTLQTPQSFTVQLSGGAKIKDVNNRTANIIATDVQCSNGVIHVLDKVLLPTF